MVKALKEWHGYSIQAGCQLVDLPRSSYYYCAQAQQEDELKDAIQSVAGQYPTYGTRRIARQLRRPPYRYPVGRKRIQRLMRSMNLLRPVKRGSVKNIV